MKEVPKEAVTAELSVEETVTVVSALTKPMGNVEEEMERLEASSNLLDTSIESEATALLEIQKKEEEIAAASTSAEQDSNKSIASNVSMEIDSESLETPNEEKHQSESKEEVKLNLIDRFDMNLKTCMDKGLITEIAESVVDLDSLNQLDDRIDEAKLQLIAYFNSLQKAIRGRVDKIRNESSRK